MNVYTYKNMYGTEPSFFLGNKGRRTLYHGLKDFFEEGWDQDLTEHFCRSLTFDPIEASFCVPEEFLK